MKSKWISSVCQERLQESCHALTQMAAAYWPVLTGSTAGVVTLTMSIMFKLLSPDNLAIFSLVWFTGTKLWWLRVLLASKCSETQNWAIPGTCELDHLKSRCGVKMCSLVVCCKPDLAARHLIVIPAQVGEIFYCFYIGLQHHHWNSWHDVPIVRYLWCVSEGHSGMHALSQRHVACSHWSHRQTTELIIIILIVDPKWINCGLSVFAVKSLYGDLHYEGKLLCEAENNQDGILSQFILHLLRKVASATEINWWLVSLLYLSHRLSM